MIRYRQGIILLVVLTSAGCVFGMGLNEMIKLGHETVMEVLDAWQKIVLHIPSDRYGSTANLVFMKMMENELHKQIEQVSKNIDEHQERIENKVDTILVQLMQQTPTQRKLEDRLTELDHYIGQVHELYKLFEMYANNSNFEQYTMLQFAKACVSPRLGELPDVLKSIHRIIIPSMSQVHNSSLLVLLARQMKDVPNQVCTEMQSPQQLLYNLYNTVALTEIKGYTMIQFSYMLLRLYNKGEHFSEELRTLKYQYRIRTYETLSAIKIAMALAPRDVWKCDPSVHKLDETYTELNQLFQGFIVNEVDLNSDNTCRENCAYYQYTKSYGCFHNLFCSQQRQCHGKILYCEYIDSDMWVCPTDNTNSSRRYEYIEYENGIRFGITKTCPKDTIKVDSWWRWIFWHCSYCFCYCDEQSPKSDRYFSLRSVMSDISNNKVITGIRFKKIDKVIYIQIQEGQLLPGAAINTSTIEWQPVNTFSLMDHNVVHGVDYHKMTWEKRALDLDDLSSSADHLLTGIRFRMVGSRLNLEIRVTPFNFTSGLLIQPKDKSFWHSNDITDRTELKLHAPDVPIHSSVPTMPDSGKNQYLNFAPSDRKKDAAQSTIPFFDIQPVTLNPPVPLVGAGIFHKGQPGLGGFVALKLITYDFMPHVQSDLSPPPVLKTPNEITAV